MAVFGEELSDLIKKYVQKGCSYTVIILELEHELQYVRNNKRAYAEDDEPTEA